MEDGSQQFLKQVKSDLKVIIKDFLTEKKLEDIEDESFTRILKVNEGEIEEKEIPLLGEESTDSLIEDVNEAILGENSDGEGVSEISRLTVNKILNSHSKAEYDEEAFEFGFKNSLEPIINNQTPQNELIYPLANLKGNFDRLELSKESLNQEIEDFEIESVAIEELNDKYFSSILTYQSKMLKQGWGAFGLPVRPEYMLKVNLKGEIAEDDKIDLTDEFIRIGSNVTSFLRFQFSEADVFFPAVYLCHESYLQFREELVSITHSSSPLNNPYFGESAEASEDDIDTIQENWKKYNEYFVGYEGKLSEALRRLDSTYKREQKRDEVIDCVIALESTLLRGMSRWSSYSFRFRLRGAALASNSEEEFNQIEDTLKEMYNERSRIVHEGKNLQDENLAEDARSITKKILESYMELLKSKDSIDKINQEIDEELKPNR